MFAPDVLVLNIQNSLAHSSEKRVDNPICLLSFFSPYWVDNRTNMDLILQDHLSASPNPLLLGYQTPLDYGEVSAPGASASPLTWTAQGPMPAAESALQLWIGSYELTQQHSYARSCRDFTSPGSHCSRLLTWTYPAGVGLIEPDTPGGTHRSFWDIDNHKEIAVQPTLLNKQDTTRFCLADVARKQFSGAIHINTVGVHHHAAETALR